MSPETELVYEPVYEVEEALFIEVPAVIQEEEVEYMDLDPLQEIDPDTICVKSEKDLYLPSTDGDIAITQINQDREKTDDEDTSDLLWLLSFRLDKLLSSLKATKADSKNEEDKQGNEFFDEPKSPKSEPEDTPTGRPRRKGRKPPFTYTELIECALCERGPLTVAQLYRWISDTFPYYQADDDRWKNSVRHNLSINPIFRKGNKSTKGAGHLWTIMSPSRPNNNGETPLSRLKSWKRQRQAEKELEGERLKKRMLEEAEEEAARAVAAISNPDGSGADCLARTASDILKGIKKEVGVEFINPNKKSNDFLNPVPKEVVADECGFLSHIELNLTADTLSEQFAEADHLLDEYTVFSNQLSALPLAN